MTASGNLGGGTGVDAVMYVKGTTGGDTISGTAGADYIDAIDGLDNRFDNATNKLDGKGGDDTLAGSNGDDELTGGAGDDSLIGGAGIDTAVFTGNRADYTVTSTSVADSVSGRDGTDTLNGVEVLRFADQTITLDAVVGNVAPSDITGAPGPISGLAPVGTVVVDANPAANVVAENVAGVVGITASASDGDATTHTVTHSLVDDFGGKFAINATTGVVTTAAAINYEAGASYGITVLASSADGSSNSQSFTIAVTDVNEFAVSAIADTNAAANSVSENVAAGALVGITASASDADGTNNAVSYSLTANPGGLFAINAATGVVTTTAALDYEVAASYQITVRADSSDSSFSTANYTIAVANVNETPVITSNCGGNAASINVAENGTAVTTVVAVDPEGTTPTYSISGGADALKFHVSSTGVLTFVTAPDFEAPGSAAGSNVYDVIVKASDGTLEDTQVLAVTVTDVAETITVNLTAADDSYVALTGENYVVDGLGGNDTITTQGGNDVVRGGAGDDTISTGGGNDTITYLNSNNGVDAVDGGLGYDRIVVTANNTTIGLRSLAGVEEITGNGFTGTRIVLSGGDDTIDFSGVTMSGIISIDGGAGADTIIGSAADDTIIGGKGNDVMSGGAGNDIFLIGVSSSLDTIDGGADFDTVQATADGVTLSVTSLTNVERISSGGFANFRIVMTAAANTLDLSAVDVIGVTSIDAGNGDDTIIGSGGSDVIEGNGGNDNLSGGNGDDVFLFGTNTGVDTINGGSGNDTIRANIANAVLTFGSYTGVEAIDGGGFANVKIAGGTGADVLDLSPFVLTGIAAIDGGSGNDTITGSSGADRIIGGLGADVLTGGSGVDIFTYTALAESRTTTIDTILDFIDGTDKIDLSAIDANTALANDQAFNFIGTAAFSGSAGELRYQFTGGATHVYVDVDGNKTADMDIILSGSHTLLATDFVL